MMYYIPKISDTASVRPWINPKLEDGKDGFHGDMNI